MKKLFFFASAAALLATSCSDDLGLKNSQGEVPEGNFTIVASYQIGNGEATRTELETNGSSKSYTWQEGDAIGVFNAGETLDVTNAVFRYVPGSDNQFKGDLNSLDGAAYIAYYPRYDGAVLDNDVITLTVSPYQNYNHLAVEGQSWTLNPPSGSFSQDAAPAVAYGTASNGQLSMRFKPVASYFVVPVTNNTEESVTIKNATLGVSYNSAEQVIAGTFGVNTQPLTQSSTADPTINNSTEDNNGITALATDTEQGKLITLNCGQGVTLGVGESTNFWFVVPASVPFAESTITVQLFDGPTDGEPIRTIEKEVMSSVETVGMNNIWRIMPASNQAYMLEDEGLVISTAAQFLEYAYVATNGEDAVYEWVEMMNKYSNYSQYSNLANMLQFEDEKTITELLSATSSSEVSDYVSGLKPAMIVGQSNNTLSISQALLKSDLSGLNLNGAIPDYLAGAFQGYATQGYIPSIGGGYPFTLTGAAENMGTTLSGLGVQGESIFAENTAATLAKINNLSLNNLTLTETNATADYYAVLATPKYTWFNGVTVGTITVKGGNPKAETGLIVTEKSSWSTAGAAASWEEGTNTVSNIVNNSKLLFAQTCQINSTYYDFSTAGHAPTDFGTIEITTDGTGALLVVNSGATNATSLMNAIADNEDNDGIIYSVIDNSETPTSYWTGMTIASSNSYAKVCPGTSEFLASTVAVVLQEVPGTSRTINMVYNLDLMGKQWWAYNNSNGTGYVILNGSEDANTISNVYINGYQASDEDMENPTTSLTLLGFQSQVNDVTINGITVENNGEEPIEGAYIGGVSVRAATATGATSSNIKVLNMTVDADDAANNAVGGVYAALSYAGLENLEEVWSNLTLTGDVEYYGYLSGAIDLFPTSSVTSFEYTGGGHAFGVVNVKVDADGATNSLTVTVNGFGANYNPTSIGTAPFSGFTLYLDDYSSLVRTIYKYLVVGDTDELTQQKVKTAGYYYAGTATLTAPKS